MEARGFSPLLPDAVAFGVGGLLEARCVAAPHRLAYRFIERSGAVRELSYSRLWCTATAVAKHLVNRGAAGQRVLLACTAQLNFVVGFYACMLAGCVAVPAPPIASRRLGERMRLLASDSGAALVIADGDAWTAAARDIAFPVLDMRAIDMEFPPGQGTPDRRLPRLPADALAFLQYTSGSTSAPKGVMVTHRNVLANCATIAEAMGLNESARVLTSLPLFHDMGLVGGVLATLFSGAEASFIDPAQVVQEPASWLRAIHRYQISVCGGPNFLYELVSEADDAQLEGLDLSSVAVAFCGAEPIRPATAERFTRRFAPYGMRPSAFYPCYGLAEATLFVTGVGVGEPLMLASDLLGSARVSCGRPWRDTRVAIVDPATGRSLPDGAQGEIWVRGESVAAGYWGQPELSAQVFSAFLQGTGDGPFLRTGDLGIMKQGRLHVAGRIKDLIILRGRKLVPQDVEEEAERSHEAVRASAAFSCSGDEGERLVLIAEVRRDWLRRDADRDAVRRAIRAALFSAFQVQAHAIELVPPNALARTSSGKVRRSHIREQFLAGGVSHIAG